MALVDDNWLNGNFETETSTNTGTTGYTQSRLGEAATDFGIKAGMKALGVSSPTIRGVLDDAEDGRFDPAKTGISAATEAISSAVGGYSGLIGGALNTGYTGIKEGPGAAVKSATKTGLGMAGSILGSTLGPIGAKVGGWAGSKLAGLAIDSFEDGYIGDAFDARDSERARDSAENDGWSVSQTAEMAAMDNSPFGNAQTKSGYSLSPSLSSQDTYGKAAYGAFGSMSFDAFGGNDIGDNDSGGGDGNDNDSGAGGGTNGSSNDGSGENDGMGDNDSDY